MPNYNSATFIGHAGGDPVVRTLPDGKRVANFSVAVNRKRGDTQEVMWVRCAAWDRQADVAASYVRKGNAVMVVGEVWLSSYTRDDGAPGASLELTVRSLVLLGSKQDEYTPPSVSDDIPF